ncbi:murein transglycosylase [Flavobacterium akiainvivens]|uniref:Murein transglycosylase n=1 Tax=Flavobacterium akiainvivens TaxID=1202724 RepID=A0A0M8MJV9_9FLAO|nr:lytic transglycosylase domain-containing protein [Flavobacterium akiainvivens]KOS07038.1 murein transglycosylase [Flavobacterium akiainvivens]SFQ58860.1 membrane-bound lytic murein transglycosylase D [Flavobacterium akiainvivens]
MNKRRTLAFVFAAVSWAGFAQESADATVAPAPEVKLSYLDSIKASFVRHPEMARIDSLWMKEMGNEDLFADMQSDLAKINPDDEVADFSFNTELFKKRLEKMDARSPFHIEYNKGLENIVKAYLKNRPRSYERLMAISEYYFPMFEEYLAKYNVPIEIKYLAVIESALNPRAKSHVGATGLWQFMYPTGKQYNLEVNSYVDERCDPLKATEAACQYLSSLYNIFGDWDLVLASYNAGPGNVTKAIRRSGEYRNYWNIRKNLPKETQAYNPTFLATMYIYEYAKEHGIKAKRAPLTYFETDTVMVKRQMSFKQIASVLDVPVSQLQFLNPIYKLDVIPYQADKAHYLRLPKDKLGLFVSNEAAVYAYIDHEADLREKPYFKAAPEREEAYAATTPSKKSKKKTNSKTQSYTVKRGDNLGAISNKYGVSVAELKQWNKIKGNNIQVGQKLKIVKTITVTEPVVEEAIAEAPKKPETKTTAKDAKAKTADKDNTEDAIALNTAEAEEAIAAVEAKPAIVKKQKDISTYEDARMYIVQKGDSLFSIAKKHPGVTVENLKNWNKINGNSITPGMKLKVEETN